MEYDILDNAQIENIVFLHDIEEKVEIDFIDLEEDIQQCWGHLKGLDMGALYSHCPYFGTCNQNIKEDIRHKILRITDGITRLGKQNNLTLEFNWYGICGDYDNIIDELCDPYAEAFFSSIFE